MALSVGVKLSYSMNHSGYAFQFSPLSWHAFVSLNRVQVCGCQIIEKYILLVYVIILLIYVIHYISLYYLIPLLQRKDLLVLPIYATPQILSLLLYPLYRVLHVYHTHHIYVHKILFSLTCGPQPICIRLYSAIYMKAYVYIYINIFI